MPISTIDISPHEGQQVIADPKYLPYRVLKKTKAVTGSYERKTIPANGTERSPGTVRKCPDAHSMAISRELVADPFMFGPIDASWSIALAIATAFVETKAQTPPRWEQGESTRSKVWSLCSLVWQLLDDTR